MSFFQKEETDPNLLYDDVAYIYFVCTVLGFTAFLVLISLVKAVKQFMKLIPKEITKMPLFEKQIGANSKRTVYRELRKSIILQILLLVALGVAFFAFATSIDPKLEMQAFDPFNILEIEHGSTQNEIKKAFRKLALVWHPDRNQDPLAGVKFVRISKAYKCLTDDTARENWEKYGNPDGQVSQSIGIGLPKLIVSGQFRSYFLLAILGVILIIVPRFIVNWLNSMEAKDEKGLLIENYDRLLSFFNPSLNPFSMLVALSILKQLQKPPHLIEPKRMEELNSFIKHSQLPANFLNDSELCVLDRLIGYLSRKKELEPQVVDMLPKLINALVFFSVQFSSYRTYRAISQTWNRDTSIPQFLGVRATDACIQLSRMFYNRFLAVIAPQQQTAFMGLLPDQIKLYLQNPVPIRKFLEKESFFGGLLSHLGSDERKAFVRNQFSNLPYIKLEAHLEVNGQIIDQFSQYDHPKMWYKVTKLRPNSGYSNLSFYQFLKREIFYLVASTGIAVQHFEQIEFKKGQQVVEGTFPYRRGALGKLQIITCITSDCYAGLDDLVVIDLEVVTAKEPQVYLNKEDMEIQKLSKTPIEEMLMLDLHPSDREMSSGEEEEDDQDEEEEDVNSEEEDVNDSEKKQGNTEQETEEVDQEEPHIDEQSEHSEAKAEQQELKKYYRANKKSKKQSKRK